MVSGQKLLCTPMGRASKRLENTASSADCRSTLVVTGKSRAAVIRFCGCSPGKCLFTNPDTRFLFLNSLMSSSPHRINLIHVRGLVMPVDRDDQGQAHRRF